MDSTEAKQNSNYWPSFILTATVMLLLLFYQIWDSYDKTIEAARTHATNSTAVIEQAISVVLETVNISLEHLKYDFEHNPKKNQITSASLKAHKTAIERITSVEIRATNEKGDIIASTTPIDPQKLINITDRNYFQFLSQNHSQELYISEPFFGKVRSKWVTILARRMENSKTHQFLGVIFASIEVDYFETYPKLLKLNSTSLFAISLGDSLSLAYRFPNKPEAITGKPGKFNQTLLPLARKEAHQMNSMEKSNVDGVRRILSATWVGNYPIVVLIGTEYNEAIKPWLVQSIVLLLIAIIIFTFGVFTVKRFSVYNQTIINQQTQLINSAKFTALGEMSANIAHEINNPLAIVTAHIDKIERLGNQPEMNKVQLSKSITTIGSTLKRIDRIVKGLRNFSRKTPEKTEPVALKNVFDDTFGICSERFHNAGVKLELPTSGLETRINADQTQVTQVLVNLLVNSIEAISELPEKWVKIQLSVKNGFAIIIVTDSGTGISLAHQEKLMEPFFTTKKIGKGTGLGLSISKGIVESFGGKFWYDKTSPNTKFVVEIPVAN